MSNSSLSNVTPVKPWLYILYFLDFFRTETSETTHEYHDNVNDSVNDVGITLVANSSFRLRNFYWSIKAIIRSIFLNLALIKLT